MNNFENVERIVQDSQYYLDRNDKAKYILSQNLTDEQKTLAFLLLDGKIDSTLPFIEHTKAMSNKHIPWPDIRQFHQVRKDVQWRAQFTGKFDADESPIMDRTAVAPKLMFEGTVKLHGCFHENTPITLANGETGLIKNIAVGMSVLSYDEVEKKFVPKCVTHVYKQNINKPWVKLHFQNGKSLTCTADHKIFTTNRGWVEAQYLKSEDIFLNDKDEFAP